jgi:hypothetical protein
MDLRDDSALSMGSPQVSMREHAPVAKGVGILKPMNKSSRAGVADSRGGTDVLQVDVLQLRN